MPKYRIRRSIKIFLVGDNAAGTFTAVFGTLRYHQLCEREEYQLPVPEGLPLEGYQLVRWGQDGLVLRAYDSVGGSLAGYQLLLFRGPLCFPRKQRSIQFQPLALLPRDH